jgi:hypothetical protein
MEHTGCARTRRNAHYMRGYLYLTDTDTVKPLLGDRDELSR